MFIVPLIGTHLNPRLPRSSHGVGSVLSARDLPSSEVHLLKLQRWRGGVVLLALLPPSPWTWGSLWRRYGWCGGRRGWWRKTRTRKTDAGLWWRGPCQGGGLGREQKASWPGGWRHWWRDRGGREGVGGSSRQRRLNIFARSIKKCIYISWKLLEATLHTIVMKNTGYKM